jgi:hypothetical protein
MIVLLPCGVKRHDDNVSMTDEEWRMVDHGSNIAMSTAWI